MSQSNDRASRGGAARVEYFRTLGTGAAQRPDLSGLHRDPADVFD